MAKIMARLGIAAGLRLWLGRSEPVEDALYASAGSQAKLNLRSPGATTLLFSSLSLFYFLGILAYSLAVV